MLLTYADYHYDRNSVVFGKTKTFSPFHFSCLFYLTYMVSDYADYDYLLSRWYGKYT